MRGKNSLAFVFVPLDFEPLNAARAQGKILGRPKGPGKSKLDQYKPEIVALLNNGSSKTFIAKRYKTSIPNFYKWLKKEGIKFNAK
jgi:DNA invertase Pin-like site-specific DNA recombinase